MIQVDATREGLEGHGTSTGWPISDLTPFVALPSHAAMYQWVIVRNPSSGLYLPGVVLDVGPWNENDDAYVFSGARPAAERGIGAHRTPTNKAGIDLGNLVWDGIKMADNGPVDWAWWADPSVQRSFPDAFDRLAAILRGTHA